MQLFQADADPTWVLSTIVTWQVLIYVAYKTINKFEKLFKKLWRTCSSQCTVT